MISVNAIGNTFTDLAYNDSLFLTPPYLIGDCNNGVIANTPSQPLPYFPVPPVNLAPTGAVPKCCITIVWTWDCENGCQSLGGLPTPGTLVIGSEDPNSTLWALQSDCEQNILIYYGVMNVVGDVPCSWWCDDPYIVYNPPTPGPYQSPCIPWYTLGSPPTPMLGPFADELLCITACTANVECWVCDCNSQPSPCVSSWPNPCPTLISTSPNTYGPDPGGGLNGIPSFATAPDCVLNCLCDFGWDCFHETGTTASPTIPPVNIGCTQGISLSVIIANNWQVSDPTPGFTGYTSFSACCYANQGCCYSNCDDNPSSPFNISTYTAPGYPTPLGDWPCSYLPTYAPNTSPCNDPSVTGYVYDPAFPWCFIFDCTNALCPPTSPPGPGPSCCEPEDTTCDCACPPPVNSTGAWDSLYQAYDRDDAVFWGDTDTEFCCFKCWCDIILPPTTPTPNDPTTYDCNHFTPGDPDAGSVPNCWRSCQLTPGDLGSGSGSGSGPFIWQGTSYDPCTGCTSGYTQGYECTPDGCQPSPCNPAMGTGYIFNCYNNPTCDDGSGDECVAQCFCIPGTNPCIPMCATYQQELILASGPIPTDCPPNVYAYISYNECMGINPVNASLPDCCPGPLPPQWYCDDSADCSGTYPPVVNVDGTGCVQINSSHALYQNPNISNHLSLLDCQAKCSWCCDPNGVTVCTFVAAPANCAGNSYLDALDCYLATTTATPCDCSIPPTEFWCHYNHSASMGGCVTNIGGLLDINLFGLAAVTRDIDPNAYFTSMVQCEEACRFCCDCDSLTSNPGTCYLNWYCAQFQQCICNSGWCNQTLINCIVDEQPCIAADPDYYCDDILGCIVYPIVNTLMSGPYTGPLAQTNCQLVCQFECNDVCQCAFTSTPTNPVSTPPCYTLACCNAVTTFGQKCCECDDCINGNYSYSYDNGMGTLVTYWITISSFNSPPAPWTPTPTANGGTYIQGDIVTQDGCCFIMVLSTGDWFSYDTTMLPCDYYNLYMNALNTSGLPQYGVDLMWIPCNPDCCVVSYEERWWCDDNNPQYPYQITNCIEEFPYIDNEITANISYGDNVWGTDGGAYGSQISYTNGGTPFSSLIKCQEWCKFCCEPAGPTDCCCCEDDGFGNCLFGTQQMSMNPTGIPCDQLCNGLSKISCPEDCCCCKEDLMHGGCIPGTQQSYPNPTGAPCNQLCHHNILIMCPNGGSGSGQGNCKICCVHDDLQGTTYYIVQGPSPCYCNVGDTQVSMGNCSVVQNMTPSPRLAEQAVHTRGGDDPGGPIDPVGLMPPKNTGLQPCCIVCQTPGGSQYQVSQPSSTPPCKCNSWLDIILSTPCAQPPVGQPCFLDWGCDTCPTDCYDSWYSCMTLTNNCSEGDCADCVGIKSWYWWQGGIFGYWNPTQWDDNSMPNTFDGWDGTNIIPHTSAQIWNNTQPYWNYGQIVIDPDYPACCFVRTELEDVNVVPNLLPDQYPPSAHWCNYLSGNSADGANMYSPPGGTPVTIAQNYLHPKPWWVPCDESCIPCDTGGTAPWSWKCIDGIIGGCVTGQFPYGDPHTFANQGDCDALCKSYLCNNNPYWWAETKCSNANHNTVQGGPDDFLNWFINHSNDTLAPGNYVYTNIYTPPQPGCPLCAPCAIPPPSGVGTGGMCSVQMNMWNGYLTNFVQYPPPSGYVNPNGGTSDCAGTSPFYGSSYLTWAATKSGLLTSYGTDVSDATSVQDVRDVMSNIGCQWIWDSAEFMDCQNHCGGACSGPQLATANLYNHSGMYTHPTTNTCERWQTPGQSMHPAGDVGCCKQLSTSHRPCHCSLGTIACDCWLLPGTGTTGGPQNVWDYAYHLDDYVDCTTNCCSGNTCACCEPDLTAAGLLPVGTVLDWLPTGAGQWYTNRATGTYEIGQCFTFPHDNLGGTNVGDLSGIWNYGSGTLSGGCCVCCVDNGPGGNSDPLNDGIPGDCFWEANTTSVYPANHPNYPGNPHWGFGPSPPNPLPYPDINSNPGVISVNFYDYLGQWAVCGVKEDCTYCGTPLTLL